MGRKNKEGMTVYGSGKMGGVGVVMYILACYTDCVGTEISYGGGKA